MSDFDHFIGTRPVSGASTRSTPPPCRAWLTQHLEDFAGPA
jgi:hypothetical protein